MFSAWRKINISVLLWAKNVILNGFILPHGKEIKICFYSVVFCYIFFKNVDVFSNSECFIEMPSDTSKIFREPEDCVFCKNITSIDKISDISPAEFYEDYTKQGRPAIVTDAMRNWQALTKFNFQFFKSIYENIKLDDKNCQFFPYKTEFKNLVDVFKMSDARANFLQGEKPWYVGWNNCNENAGKILRQYYTKPYFLGNQSENIAMSWIFMGGPGYGAQMHIDNVHYASWQAQVSGRKLWKLAPPPECWNVCHRMEMEVHRGEIIVVDTNRWYHQTIVQPGEISITIGSEFD